MPFTIIKGLKGYKLVNRTTGRIDPRNFKTLAEAKKLTNKYNPKLRKIERVKKKY